MTIKLGFLFVSNSFGHCRPGRIQCYARTVYEKRRGISARFLSDGSLVVRRDLQISQTNPAGERSRRVSHAHGRQQGGSRSSTSGNYILHFLFLRTNGTISGKKITLHIRNILEYKMYFNVKLKVRLIRVTKCTFAYIIFIHIVYTIKAYSKNCT